MPAGNLGIVSGVSFLSHFGLSRPYRFERIILAGLAVVLGMLAVGAALWMRSIGELPVSGPRGEYFLYLLALLVLAIGLVRWPWVAGMLLALAALELTGGAGLFALQRERLVDASLMPPGHFELQRFQWHALLQAVPIPSLDVTSPTGLTIRHTSEGTRGKDPVGSLEGRTVIATIGGSTTYDIGESEGSTWSDRLARVLDEGDEDGNNHGQGRFFIVNHGVPGYTTAEHLIQTAFYQRKFGQQPRCALYYVGWNDLRNAHIPNLDAGYADFHLPSQIDSLQVRRVGGAHVTISPVLTLLLRFVAREFDTARYFVDPYGRPAASGDDPALTEIYERNIRAISAINRQRGVTTIWVGQLLNRERMGGKGRYGWLPLVRDRDVGPLLDSFNAILARTARDLGDIYVDIPPPSFVDADFVDNGHFSGRGSQRFAAILAPVVRQACR
jgi:lysophospholipase L1-like esterase